MQDTPYYGWFSKKALEHGVGTVIYRRDDGQEFECSVVSKDTIYEPGWDDAVFLGEVGQFVRHGQHSTHSREFAEESRLMKIFPLKLTTKQIQEILVDGCPEPIIVEKK